MHEIEGGRNPSCDGRIRLSLHKLRMEEHRVARQVLQRFRILLVANKLQNHCLVMYLIWMRNSDENRHKQNIVDEKTTI